MSQENDRRYLPICNEDGSWIDRPDLFLLALMGAPDTTDIVDVWQIHAAMLVPAPIDRITEFEKGVEKKHIRGDTRLREFAGGVVLEALRLSHATQQPPSATKAIELATWNHIQFVGSRDEESMKREIRRGFKMFMNTCHLQAALYLDDPPLNEIVASEADFIAFLSRARAFEEFFDNNLQSDKLRWNPWRIPQKIKPNYRLDGFPLTKEELAAIGL